MPALRKSLVILCLAIIGGGVATAARAQAPDHLAPLEWMIGEWAGETPHGSVILSAQWCDDGHFIVRKFLAVGNDGMEIGASQRIGWDPRKKQFKSWSFDSQGGFGEGYWRQEGKNWVVDSTEVTADGEEVKITATYTPESPDQFIWEVKSAKLAEAGLPALRVEFHRAKAEANATEGDQP